MAGNIIHAIATTNATIAGMIVVEAIKILTGCHKQCKVRKKGDRLDLRSKQIFGGTDSRASTAALQHRESAPPTRDIKFGVISRKHLAIASKPSFSSAKHVYV